MRRTAWSLSVPVATLQSLHASELDASDSQEIADLFRSVGGERLSPVYELSLREVAEDTYGFAREFKLILRPGSDAQEAMDILSRSSFVKSVKPLIFRRAFE